MPALKLPTEWPPLVVKSFDDIVGAYRKLRDFSRSLEDFRGKLVLVVNDHGTKLTPETGTTAPASTPADLQLFYIDTVAGNVYMSIGTSSSADWKLLT